MPNEKSDSEEKLERALEQGFASIESEAAAEKTLSDLEKEAGGLNERDIVESQAPETAARVVEKIESSAEASKEQRAAAVIAETAEQIAQEPTGVERLDTAIGAAARDKPTDPERLRRGRRLLRKQLFRRLRPLQALDAIVFTEINALRHPPAVDRAVLLFSRLMTGGHAWAIVILIDALQDRRHSRRAALGVLPALWLTTFTVEQGIKRFFRRRRPFISIVRAIVVGRKPGSYSFPSGHSAAASAGATLLAIYYPRGAKFFRVIAGLVAFARVYLGAHYPGDVISGSIAGAILGRSYRAVFLKLVGVKHRPPKG
jgi:membrane-associated phospholipid phosphatase